MNVVYYAQHVRDFFWVQPIWEETSGAFCSELPEIAPLFAQYAPGVPFQLLKTPRRFTVGRAIGNRRLTIKNKARRLQLSQIARELQPDVIVTTSNHRHAMPKDKTRRTKQVQAFHGVSSKNVKFNPWMADFDLLLLPGKRERDKFAALGVLDDTQYALIGHPKSDRVLRGELTREAARARYNLPDAPTVLYAPTHGALSSFFSWGLEICRAVPRDWNLIVKPHPVLATTTAAEGAGGETLAQVKNFLQERSAENKTLWLPLEPDVVPLMAAADILITDYSSVAEEFLVFDRPLIFADHLADATGRDRQQRDKGDWNELFAVGERVTEVAAMPAAIAGVLLRPDEQSSARLKMRDFVFENLNGHCAERAADAIRTLVKS
jgi:CDP-glycerol glycerophosphotransferase (TagB/SpsB family)